MSGISPLIQITDFRGSVSNKAQSELNSRAVYPPYIDAMFNNQQTKTAVRSESQYSAWENFFDAK